MLLQVADMLTPFLPQTADNIRGLFASGVVPQELAPLFPRVYIHTLDPRGAKQAS